VTVNIKIMSMTAFMSISAYSNSCLASIYRKYICEISENVTNMWGDIFLQLFSLVSDREKRSFFLSAVEINRT